MINKIAFFVFQLFFIVTYSQYTDLVEYQMTVKFGGQTAGMEKFFLLMNDEGSMGIRYIGSEDYAEVVNHFDLKKSIPRIQNFSNTDYQLFSIGSYKFYFFKDELPKVNWQVKVDKKEILGFNCQKAVGEFRGRKYTVWFTTDIPYNYGPWKLRGLPGLILESTDDKRLFNYKAVKVSLNTDIELPKEFEQRWNEDYKLYPFTKYVEFNDKKLMKLRKQGRSKLPKGTKFINLPLRNLEPELIYEWDVNK